MGIVYLGNVQEINEELAKVKPVLDARYEEVLGSENARKLRNESARLLTRNSFFNSLEEMTTRLKAGFTEDTSNKMFVLTPTDMKPDIEGRVARTKVRSAPAFYISPEGFNHSHSHSFTENPLASYVHEYDHFVWYVIQKVPLYLLNFAIQNALDLKGTENPEKVTESLFTRKDLPLDECNLRLLLQLHRKLFTFSFERATRILDKMVLKSVSIDVPLEWRGKPKEYVVFPLISGKVVLPVDGDPFLGMTDEEVVKSFTKWEDTCVPAIPYPYIVNFLESIRSLKVSRVSIDELMRLK